jgi:tetratricopeptide (TPR) repeat protein
MFLGPRRFRAFLALLAITGLASLALSVIGPGSQIATAIQSVLLVAFLLGGSYMILGRLPAEERMRWLAIIVPSVLGIIIGSALLPHLTGLFVGAGIGWIVAGIFIFRDVRGPQNYRRAVKAMRKGDYPAAIACMTAEIREKPGQPEHYRFRAELHRLAGDLASARGDYQRMAELDEESAVAFNGLAEVELQAGNLKSARRAAVKAHELAPDEWVAAYNLGMIEDKLQESEAVVRNLRRALALKIPDSRHRLLAHLYLWRAHGALGAEGSTRLALGALKSEKGGLEEWQVIMSADEAEALREVLSDDIEEARRLIMGERAHVPK